LFRFFLDWFVDGGGVCFELVSGCFSCVLSVCGYVVCLFVGFFCCGVSVVLVCGFFVGLRVN